MARARAAKPTREDRIDAGVALLQQALGDLVRGGLARRDDDVLGELQRRLVDAQAPGLGAAIGRLAVEEDPERLVLGLGRLQLMCDAWNARDRLDEGLRADVRANLGIALNQAAVKAHGDVTHDRWLVLAQAFEADELRDLHTTRTWLRGVESGRTALHLAFVGGMFSAAPSRRPKVEVAREVPAEIDPDAPLEPGTTFEGLLAFWPSALPQRALVMERGAAEPLTLKRLPGRMGVGEWLDAYAAMMATQPFLWRSLVVLGDVRVAPGADLMTGQVIDGAVALPFVTARALTLFAVSGGHAIDLIAEWDGRLLRPLAVIGRDGYFALEHADV